MAKFEKIGKGNFNDVLNKLHKQIINKSISASFEEESYFYTKDAKVAVRVYERYGAMGGNRLSLTLVLFEINDVLHLSLTSTGGSQGMFLKINTWSEENFLNTVKDLADQLIK